MNAKGDLDGAQHAGNLFFSPALASALGPSIAGAYVGGFASLPGDVKTPEIEAYLASADATWESLPPAPPAVRSDRRAWRWASASATATTSPARRSTRRSKQSEATCPTTMPRCARR